MYETFFKRYKDCYSWYVTQYVVVDHKRGIVRLLGGWRVRRIKRWIYRWLKGRSGRTKKGRKTKKEGFVLCEGEDDWWVMVMRNKIDRLINWKRFLELTVVLNNCLEQYGLQVIVRMILIKDVRSFICNIYIEYYWKLNFCDNDLKLNIKKDHYY